MCGYYYNPFGVEICKNHLEILKGDFPHTLGYKCSGGQVIFIK
jgi:hypothetical protein